MSLVDDAIRQLDTNLCWVTPRQTRRKLYRWSPREDALLRRICTRHPRAEVAVRLTALLREITGDPDAVRSINACYIRFQQLGMVAYDGEPDEIKLADAARQVGLGREFLDWAAETGQLPTRRAGKVRLVKTRDLANWFVAIRERQIARSEMLDILESQDLVDKKEAMALAGLSETHITRYLQCGVIAGWRVPDLRPGRFGVWLVRRDSINAFVEARASGRLSEYLGQFPAYGNWRKKSDAEVYALRRAGRVSATTPEDSEHHRRIRQAIARAGLLTVRDLSARWGCRRDAVCARVRRYRVPSRMWGRYLVFELAAIEAIERSKGW